jgi:probable rRNA maturation factor
MNRVIISNEQTKFEFCDEYSEIIIKAVNVTAQDRDEDNLEVSVLITDNNGIKQLNGEYRGVDNETDVLSFPMREYSEDGKVISCGPGDDDNLLGDIVISLEKAAEQGELYGHGIRREIGFLTVHSMLHLFGFDHMEDEDNKIMRSKEEEILEKMNLAIR